jgi:threonine aldolase
MLGGGMRQVGIIAAGALYALENNLNRISEDHKRAKRLVNNLEKSGLFSVKADNIQTNIVVFNVPDGFTVNNFIGNLEKNGVQIVPFGANQVRAVTHLNISDEDIEIASDIIIKTAKQQIT